MGNFSIAFTGDMADYDPSVAVGEIRLGGFHEFFHAVLGFWTVGDYRASWLTGLRRLVAGMPTSCLVTSVTDPKNTNFVTVWPLYRAGDTVHVQNSLIFLDQLDHDFDPTAPWESVHPRTVIDEDGQKISEWDVTVADIQEFLRTSAPS